MYFFPTVKTRISEYACFYPRGLTQEQQERKERKQEPMKTHRYKNLQ